ncbi:MAG: LysM peptidoglycan-binding domain-containing protein [Chloroflexi bacterium]|nr:LysM peptidoglycan-binding domain-containing protein [Chloroflexota bacterium]
MVATTIILLPDYVSAADDYSSLAMQAGVWYVVQSGDTLEAIAERYNTSTRAIIRANHVADANNLYVGQRLWVPGATLSARPPLNGSWHFVQSGDSLDSIASEYGTTPAILIRVNHLSDANDIDPGLRLWIPGGVLEPSITSLPVPKDSWRGYYYANTGLSGQVVRTEQVHKIDFDWGIGSPLQLPLDGFSAVWTGRFDLDEGGYRFLVSSDDGARLYLDNRLVLNAWRNQPVTGYFVDMIVPKGEHSLRLEYYDIGGDASISLWWRPL